MQETVQGRGSVPPSMPGRMRVRLTLLALAAVRLRLARLRARLLQARRVLSQRLVEQYKSDRPDLVTVVLESNGFADLLERTEFMQRVSSQDARIIGIVRRAKAEATATAARLDRLEERAQA